METAAVETGRRQVRFGFFLKKGLKNVCLSD
jgi:hypothetical protein